MLKADITSVVCGMGIGLLGRESQQRWSDFLLLGELLPDSLGFLRGYNNPASLDTNINGIYNTNESVQGTWPLYAHKYGVLVVLCSKSFGAAQIYISDGTENIYVRKSYNLGKTWGEWLLIKGVNIT